jgi:hypothetical protein
MKDLYAIVFNKRDTRTGAIKMGTYINESFVGTADEIVQFIEDYSDYDIQGIISGTIGYMEYDRADWGFPPKDDSMDSFVKEGE